MRRERGPIFVYAHQPSGLAAGATRLVGLLRGRAREHVDLFADAVLQAEAQREDLKTTAIGDDRPVPGHEAVQPAQVAHRLRARSQQQVIGIGEQYACTQVAQLGRRDALDATGGADDAEEGRFDAAVRRVQQARPRVAVARLVGDLEANGQGSRNRVEENRRPSQPLSEISQPPMPTTDHTAMLCRSMGSPLRYTDAGEAATNCIA